MELLCWRSNVFQIAENPAGLQSLEYFLVKITLPLMVAMVNGETGNHRVESAYLRQRPVEVVLDNRDVRGSGKALAGSLQHGGREVDADAHGLRLRLQHQRQQSPVSTPKVKHSPDSLRQNFEKRVFALHSVWNLVSSA